MLLNSIRKNNFNMTYANRYYNKVKFRLVLFPLFFQLVKKFKKFFKWYIFNKDRKHSILDFIFDKGSDEES